MAYRDLRHYIAELEKRDLFRWIDAEVDKDWEITCVTRTHFRKHPSHMRPALGFRHIKGYHSPMVIGTVGASPEVYGAALEIEPERMTILQTWDRALRNPVQPQQLAEGPCQEVVLTGDKVDLGKFPIHVSTPTKDPAPFLTSACTITRDPETGDYNVGVYRIEVKGPNRTGVLWDLPSQHAAMHYKKWEERNEPMPMALAIGVDPAVLLSAVAKVPYNVSEMAVAGALRREPLPVVRCKTIDLEVPATAEIVLEGYVNPHYVEREGPFGEYTGYMGGPYQMPVFEISCITHRRDPVYQGFFSQMPPSESSLLRQLPEEANVWKHLVEDLRIPGIIDVHLPEAGGSYAMLWVRMRSHYFGQAQQVLCSAWGHYPTIAKWVIVTDEDIDIRDPFQREWCLSWRVTPQNDIFFIPNTSPILLDPSAAPEHVPLWDRKGSKICIDATKKWPDFPDIALPPDEMLGRVARQWGKYGL